MCSDGLDISSVSNRSFEWQPLANLRPPVLQLYLIATAALSALKVAGVNSNASPSVIGFN